MRYILNKSVIFRPEDGAIWLNGDDEKITLTPTAKRLLTLLIEEHGKVLPRDQILTQVWDRFSLESSNNSLNQYISQLRRTLAGFGLPDNVITTIPRVGFVFHEEIAVEKIAGVSDTPSSKSAPSSFLSRQKKKVCYLFMLLPCILAVFYSIYQWRIENQVEQPRYAGEINSCPVYTLDYREHTTNILDKVRQFMSSYQLECSAGDVIYFYVDPKVMYGDKGKAYIAICSGIEQKLSSCLNTMAHEWQEQ